MMIKTSINREVREGFSNALLVAGDVFELTESGVLCRKKDRGDSDRADALHCTAYDWPNGAVSPTEE